MKCLITTSTTLYGKEIFVDGYVHYNPCVKPVVERVSEIAAYTMTLDRIELSFQQEQTVSNVLIDTFLKEVNYENYL